MTALSTANQMVHTGSRVTSSLAGATAAVTGSAVDFGVGRTTFTMQTTVTGTPATISVVMEGSLDGVTYSTLGTSSSITGDQTYSVDKPQRYVRARLATLVGGTSPTVTALIVAGP